MIVVLAEKPSVAREIAQVLGATTRCDGYFEGQNYQVTWAIGHLVEIARPDAIEASWKLWARETLPMIPDSFPLVVLEDGRAQFRVVERLLCARETSSLIAATDAGREGELIFRYIYQKVGCDKPWRRLWLASMTPDAIRDALRALRPGRDFDGLADAARARSQADWLVGMNFTRAYTLTHGPLYPVGRVQTPTLAMVVARDQEIVRFVPKPYLEVEATFQADGGRYKGIYYEPPEDGLVDEHGRLRAFQAQRARLAADGGRAEAVARRARAGAAQVLQIEQALRRSQPPQLFDLTSLQKECNRLFGLTAKETLDAAQELYEKHKALSYPRTDCRYLSVSVAHTLPAIVKAIAPSYAGLVAADSGAVPNARWVDDAKIGDHHALIPTAVVPQQLAAASPAALVYDLVCRRTLMMWHPELLEAVTRLLTEVREGGVADLYASQGTSVEAAGWTLLELRAAGPSERDRQSKLPGGLVQGAIQQVVDVTVHKKATRPPHSYTEATLLAAMEVPGRNVTDDALREILRESAPATPATRAATIEKLLDSGCLERFKTTLKSTRLGRALIAAVSEQVASAEMTGRWEQRLRRIERREESLDSFMRDIEAYVRETVSAEEAKPMAARPRRGKRGAKRKRNAAGRKSAGVK